MNAWLHRLGVKLPIIQAPMAGISPPAMAGAVSNAGGLGSIGVGNLSAEAARAQIRLVRTLTDRPFNVNVFCHQPAVADPERESAWLQFLSPHFARFGAKPPIVSFHFGLPSAERIAALKSAGIILLATATNLSDSRRIHAAGVDAIVAQGYEAGGHRGVFDLGAHDECLPTLALTRQPAEALPVPIIAAGGIMNGAGIAAALAAGASAAQLGTAFILCPESSADSGYRHALSSAPALRTVITSAISGRPARSLANLFTAIGESVEPRSIPAYPRTYAAGKELHAAAKQQGEFGYGARWAGQSAAESRTMPAADLINCLSEELREALAGSGRSSVGHSD